MLKQNSQSIILLLNRYNIKGTVADVSWSQRYHMIAVAGFGDDFPILVYYWERDRDFDLQEYKQLMDKMK